MHDFTVWVSYGKWRKNGDIRYCLLHLIHLSSIRLRRCGRILSGICEPYCLITPDLTMRYCPILILIDYIQTETLQSASFPHRWRFTFNFDNRFSNTYFSRFSTDSCRCGNNGGWRAECFFRPLIPAASKLFLHADECLHTLAGIEAAYIAVDFEITEIQMRH